MNSENSSITIPFRYHQMQPIPTRGCILLLDSDRSSVEKTEALLASCQYKVIVAERAAEALSLVGESRRKIDIVLTEFNLPDMDGLVFIERVLEIRTLPVFVLSTFENHGVKIYCLLSGAELCYDKPLNKVTAEGLSEFMVPIRDSSTTSETFDNIWDTSVSRNANMHFVDDLVLDEHEEVVADNYHMIPKKLRIRWTLELHENFVRSVDTIGFFVARPKSIHKLMNIPELTISQVANHLQRYRAQMMGKAPQTMPLGRTEITSHFNMTPDMQRYQDQMQWRAAEMMPLRMAGNSEPDFRVVPHFPPRLTPEGPIGIYNEMALRFKMLEEMNHQNALPNLNLALNAAAAVGNERLSLAPDGVRSFNFMNASNEY